jgi:hypothetical protein
MPRVKVSRQRSSRTETDINILRQRSGEVYSMRQTLAAARWQDKAGKGRKRLKSAHRGGCGQEHDAPTRERIEFSLELRKIVAMSLY